MCRDRGSIEDPGGLSSVAERIEVEEKREGEK
jgi:hypothetical protein